MDSLWVDTEPRPHFNCLSGTVKTDVLIIGGGIVGILCAHLLRDSGVSYVLVESNEICCGITKNTTAKITFQHGLIYDKLINTFGKDKAQLYLNSNRKALDEYRKLCETINCDFEVKDSFVYSLDGCEKIEKEIRALSSIGFNADYVNNLPLPFPTDGAVRFKQQAQFHPLKFAFNLAMGLNVYEHTKVDELIGTTAKTAHGKVIAKKIIVTTHFPFLNKHGSYFLKLYQQRAYVMALKNAQDVHGMYIDESQNGMSFSNYKDITLIGGGSRRTGKQTYAWRGLELFKEKHYPKSTEEHRWATQDCMTLDNMPYIGKYSANTENIFVATGFNKWGMTTAMVAAMLLRDMVLENPSPYSELYSPSRSMLHKQLALNSIEAISNLLMFTAPRCSHLGCALKWNKHEHSWDCPCHGSRFTKSGQLIDNPSLNGIKT